MNIDLKNYDLIVIGGGLTGVAAAIASAREKINVLIIEKSGYLGGSATNCLVNPFMGYSINVNENGNTVTKPINKGLFAEILNKLSELGGLHDNKRTYNEECMKLILDRMCKNNNVDVLFHGVLTDVERINNRIESIEVYIKGGKQRFKANYYIDCSGDAELATIAGCPYNLGRETDNLCQPMTLCFRIANVDEEKFRENRSKITPLYNEFQKQGKIKNPRENVLIFDHMSKGVIHFNTTRIIKKDPTNAFDVSFAEQEAREQMFEMYNFLKENIDGFQNSTIIMSAPEIGVRESRKIVGEYTIVAEDLLSCKKFPDSVAVGSYAVDIHSPDGTGTLIKKIPQGEYYTIPYRALIPVEMENLLVAGRSISSTHEAQSAYRIMPIVCGIGEGAGIATAIAFNSKSSVKDIDIKLLHSLMDKYGASY